jgi:hypothetical protein
MSPVRSSDPTGNYSLSLCSEHCDYSTCCYHQIEEESEAIWHGKLLSLSLNDDRELRDGISVKAYLVSGENHSDIFQDADELCFERPLVKQTKLSSIIKKSEKAKNEARIIVRFQPTVSADNSVKQQMLYDKLFLELHQDDGNMLEFKVPCTALGKRNKNKNPIKGFYCFALAASESIPNELLPIDGPGLPKDDLRGNLLLGFCHRKKRVIKKPDSTSLVVGEEQQQQETLEEMSTDEPTVSTISSAGISGSISGKK